MYAKTIIAILPFLAGVYAVEPLARIQPRGGNCKNLCLTVPTGALAVGQDVHLSDCADDANANAKFQKWSGPTVGKDGHETISIRDGEGSPEYCLDRGQDGAANGTALKLTQCPKGSDGPKPIPRSMMWSYEESTNHIFNYLYPETETDESKKKLTGCISFKEDTPVESGDPFAISKRIQFVACNNSSNTQIWDINPVTTSG
ncbi:hypothetical protein I302_106223 [Kwoniella bestiolae CBS 10118]|uniref:Ricin B lectin domain-containing protein n=1 Tax=Kwoniella bestiolae CBS 10118 TaxID=1296100 RepID=A0AAJ8M9W1_9TREE